jgi:hypothetical protein
MAVRSVARRCLLRRPIQTTENTKNHGGPRRKSINQYCASREAPGSPGLALGWHWHWHCEAAAPGKLRVSYYGNRSGRQPRAWKTGISCYRGAARRGRWLAPWTPGLQCGGKSAPVPSSSARRSCPDQCNVRSSTASAPAPPDWRTIRGSALMVVPTQPNLFPVISHAVPAVNAERRLCPVRSFWLCGAPLPYTTSPHPAPPVVDGRNRSGHDTEVTTVPPTHYSSALASVSIRTPIHNE